MKCPFKIPVRKVVKESKSIWVYSKDDFLICKSFGHQRADYIVHVINSHKKLALYKDYVESRINICTIPLCFSEWDKRVEDAEKSNERH